MTFFPEGKLINTEKNKYHLSSAERIEEVCGKDIILEGTAVLCSMEHDLTVRLNERLFGIIPREEGALGIKEGLTKDIAIISKVNKPCAFTVTGFKEKNGIKTPILSRRRAQELCLKNYIQKLEPGDIIPCRITHLEPFGAFCDIGCGISSMIPIDLISVSRISHPSDRFYQGQYIKAAVRKVEDGKVYLSHKELLGTWQENADLFKSGETVSGIIRSVENYGIFVELTPNLAGLAEICPDVYPSQKASVYIKSINPEKMKIKLIIIETFENCGEKKGINYMFKEHHMDRWVYSPEESPKIIETVF